MPRKVYFCTSNIPCPNQVSKNNEWHYKKESSIHPSFLFLSAGTTTRYQMRPCPVITIPRSGTPVTTSTKVKICNFFALRANGRVECHFALTLSKVRTLILSTMTSMRVVSLTSAPLNRPRSATTPAAFPSKAYPFASVQRVMRCSRMGNARISMSVRKTTAVATKYASISRALLYANVRPATP